MGLWKRFEDKEPRFVAIVLSVQANLRSESQPLNGLSFAQNNHQSL